MPVFKRGRLQETYSRKVAGLERAEEVVDVILMIRRIRRVGMRNQAVTDGGDRTRAGVGRIPRRCIILKPGMVRNVVNRRELGCPRRGRIGLSSATGRAVGIDDAEIEPTHE